MISRRNFIKATAAGGAFFTLGDFSRAAHVVNIASSNLAASSINADACQIPVIAAVDLVVVGGSAGAVAAAAAAARYGATVFLVAPLPYLGDDVCGSFNFVCRPDETPDNALSRRLFARSKYPTPLYIKTELENELIDNDVRFLYSSSVTDFLLTPNLIPRHCEERSNLNSAIVIANRSGRQAILCNAVIDATHNATVARIAGAALTPFKPEKRNFCFVTVGSAPLSLPDVKTEEVPYALNYKNKTQPVIRYTFNLEIEEDSHAALQKIEQTVRNKTWTPDQTDSSDLLEFMPLRTVISGNPQKQDVALMREISLDALQPKGFDNLWLLSPAADLPRLTAAKIMRPVHAVALGICLGETVATKITSPEFLSAIDSQKASPPDIALASSNLKELLYPLRPSHSASVTAPPTALPVLGSYDVVVLGGGTAGAPAGISAAQQGAKTLVIEYLHGLGGLTTLGLIGVYYDGYRGGYTEVINEGVRNMAPLDHPRQLKNWQAQQLSDWKQEYFRQELLKAGGELWFGAMGCGAVVNGSDVQGVIVATPYGRGIVLAKVVIDSTGSADVAIAAGADYNYTGKHVAVQGAGMGFMEPGDHYNNNDWTFIDDTDVIDISRVYVQAKNKLAGKYDMVKIPQTRERRRIVGEYSVSVYDVIGKRRYNDTVSYHKSSFDTHGMIVDPYFILLPPEKRHTIYDADVPLRALLPKGIGGVIVTGLGASADRDAMPVIRMQPCLQSQGFTAGFIAATAAREGKPLLKIDVKKIQKHLVSIGNLPERILTEKPTKAFSDKDFAAATFSVRDNYKGLEILLTDHQRCLKFVSKAINTETSDDARLIYASILCILGDSAHAAIVADAVSNADKWDAGWNYTGMGQYGPCMSRLDALIIALGKSHNVAFLPVILNKARLLNRENTFSHFRAIATALEDLASPDAIPLLYEKLTAPGMRGHHIASYRDARRKTVPDYNDTTTRNEALKELFLARALYACGDKERLGETILRNYANGLQGHYSRFAATALA